MSGKSVSIHPFVFIVIGAIMAVASFIIDKKYGGFVIFIIAGIIMSLYGVAKFLMNAGDYKPQHPREVSGHEQHLSPAHHNQQLSSAGHITQYHNAGQQANRVDPRDYRGPYPRQHSDAGYQTSSQPLNFCPRCGARAGHANFCPSCGAKLR